MGNALRNVIHPSLHHFPTMCTRWEGWGLGRGLLTLHPPASLRGAELYITEADKASGISRLMMWLAVHTGRPRAGHKAVYMCGTATHAGLMFSCTSLDSLSLCCTQKNERERQTKRETFIFFSIWSRSGWHAHGYSKPETWLWEKKIFTIKQLELEKHVSTLSTWLHLKSFHRVNICHFEAQHGWPQ